MNGSPGRVIDFMTTKQALKRGHMIGVFSSLDSDVEVTSDEGQGLSRDYDSRKETPERFMKDSTRYPLVLFSTSKGTTEVLCVPCRFDSTNAQGHVEASREQVNGFTLYS